MYKKFALMTLLVTSHITCAAVEHDQVSHLQFAKVETNFGVDRYKMTFLHEDSRAEEIGVITLLSNTQLCTIERLMPFIDKRVVNEQAIEEMSNFLQNIKNELNVSLEQVFMLEDLYVKPEFRGQGYAQILLRHICQEIFASPEIRVIVAAPDVFENEDGMRKALWGTPEYDVKQKRAIQLFQRCGFALNQDHTFIYLERASFQ